VRDPWTPRADRGRHRQLQLMNVLARGAPYHSVLTEDLGTIVTHRLRLRAPRGSPFDLVGRVPKAELRGCAVV